MTTSEEDAPQVNDTNCHAVLNQSTQSSQNNHNTDTVQIDCLNPMKSSDGFKIGHVNIRSLSNKMDELTLIIPKFDVFSVSETWLSDSVDNDSISVSVYNVYRHDRGHPYGGVCCYVKTNLHVNTKSDLTLLLKTTLNLCVLNLHCLTNRRY